MTLDRVLSITTNPSAWLSNGTVGCLRRPAGAILELPFLREASDGTSRTSRKKRELSILGEGHEGGRRGIFTRRG